jgi:predicted transcriptional regulator
MGRPQIGPRVELHLQPDVLEWVDAFAEATNMTRSEVIRRAILQMQKRMVVVTDVRS